MMRGGSHAPAIGVVLACAALWGFWWWPVALLEGAGLSGAWIGVVMSACLAPTAALLVAMRPGRLSERALLGAALAGMAVALYGTAAYYTDFLRAVLLFYLAPAWSTLIEILFFGRRWRWFTGLTLGASFAGVLLITRGGIEAGGVGLGDWAALVSGLCWSAGAAMIFSSRRAGLGGVLSVAAAAGVVGALGLASIEGSIVREAWRLPAALGGAPEAFALAALYIGVVLSGTMWGAFRLPPAAMTYLLSVEILTGLVSATVVLGEPFGPFEAAGAVLIVTAVFFEIAGTASTPKRPA